MPHRREDIFSSRFLWGDKQQAIRGQTLTDAAWFRTKKQLRKRETCVIQIFRPLPKTETYVFRATNSVFCVKQNCKALQTVFLTRNKIVKPYKQCF